MDIVLSEKIGEGMVNIPCNLKMEVKEKFLKSIESRLTLKVL